MQRTPIRDYPTSPQVALRDAVREMSSRQWTMKSARFMSAWVTLR
jgi:hypothetical protein